MLCCVVLCGVVGVGMTVIDLLDGEDALLLQPGQLTCSVCCSRKGAGCAAEPAPMLLQGSTSSNGDTPRTKVTLRHQTVLCAAAASHLSSSALNAAATSSPGSALNTSTKPARLRPTSAAGLKPNSAMGASLAATTTP